MATTPIWKDYYVTLGTASSVTFYISYGGTVVYTGKSYKRPDATNNTVRINDICASFLTTHFPLWEGTADRLYLYAEFEIGTVSGSTYTAVDTVRFVPDWSYDYSAVSDADRYTAPITLRMHPSQLVFASAEDDTGVDLTITNSTTTSSPTIDTTFEGSGYLALSDFGDVTSVAYRGYTFTVEEGCSNFVLYYRNAYGGIDSFYPQGRCAKTDTYTRHTIVNDYNNAYQYNRGKEEYGNETVRTYTINTGYLTDAQASQMFHLLGSTKVFLHDIENAEIIPVVITNSECAYKTMRGEGGKLAQYTITLEEAHHMERK